MSRADAVTYPSVTKQRRSRHRVCVVGAGIIGLTTAKRLVDEGFDVCIVARDTVFSCLAKHRHAKKEPYCSSGAGGLWWPFHLGPEDQIPKWGTDTFRVLEEHSKNLLCGIDMCEGFLLHATKTPEKPWYAPLAQLETVTPETDRRVPKKYFSAFRMKVPIVQADVYLKWLHTELVDEHKVEIHVDLNDWSFEAVSSYAREVLQADVIVNCTGVGARQFAQDEKVTPGRGVLLFGARDEAQKDFECWFTECEEDSLVSSNNDLCYAFPRGKHRVSLGGSFHPGNWQLDIADEEIDGIRDRVATVQPSLKNVPEISRCASLRPLREGGVRLETDEELRVVHNYGHGGGGFTVCWGCANSAVEQVKALVKREQWQ